MPLQRIKPVFRSCRPGTRIPGALPSYRRAPAAGLHPKMKSLAWSLVLADEMNLQMDIAVCDGRHCKVRLGVVGDGDVVGERQRVARQREDLELVLALVEIRELRLPVAAAVLRQFLLEHSGREPSSLLQLR